VNLAEFRKCFAEYTLHHLITLLRLAHRIVLPNSAASRGNNTLFFRNMFTKMVQFYMLVCRKNNFVLHHLKTGAKATSERLFSRLRRLKNYLTNKLIQEHLNHRVFLHVHKQLIDQIDLIAILQEFIAESDRRINFFGTKVVV